MALTNAIPLSKHGLQVLIAELKYFFLTGGVRSGKTVIGTIKFFESVLSKGDGDYLITASSLGAIGTNILNVKKYGALSLYPQFKKTTIEGRHVLVFGGIKIWLIGAANRSDFERLRGATLRGWFADEINLCPESFIEEAFKRMMADSEPIVVWTWNPDIETHYIYTKYVDVYLKAYPEECMYLEFNLLDNPIMTMKDVIHAKLTMSTQAFQRYVLGRRGSTEGMCYLDFSKNKHIINDTEGLKIVRYSVGVDFGESKSQNVFTLVGFTSGFEHMVVLDEVNLPGTITYDVLKTQYTVAIKRWKEKYGYNSITSAYMDKATPRKIEMMPQGLGVLNKSCRKEAIFNRIMWVNTLMNSNRFYVLSHCKNTIDAIQSAVWDKNGKRLDDGSYSVDNLDAMEYAFEPFIGKGLLGLV